MNILKNSLVGFKNTEVLELKKSERVKRPVPISTRVFTENKAQNTEGSEVSKEKYEARSTEKNKPSFRSNIKNKTKERNALKPANEAEKDVRLNEKIILFQKNERFQS